jgi:hypothetical protein
MAVYQATLLPLTHCYREQAHSYKNSDRFHFSVNNNNWRFTCPYNR